MTVRVTVGTLKGFTPKEESVFRKSGSLLQETINDPDFERRVLTASYTHLSFEPAAGRPAVQKKPADILAIIRAGTERGTLRDKEIDIAIVKDPNRKRPSVGGSYPGVLPWKTAKWFIDDCASGSRPDTISPARHMIHEWLHVSGFVHRGRKGDVPYVVGGIVRDMLKQRRALDAFEDPGVAQALEDAYDGVGENSQG